MATRQFAFSRKKRTISPNCLRPLVFAGNPRIQDRLPHFALRERATLFRSPCAWCGGLSTTDCISFESFLSSARSQASRIRKNSHRALRAVWSRGVSSASGLPRERGSRSWAGCAGGRRIGIGGLPCERGFCGELRERDGAGEMHELYRQKIGHYSTNPPKKRRFARWVESSRDGLGWFRWTRATRAYCVSQ